MTEGEPVWLLDKKEEEATDGPLYNQHQMRVNNDRECVLISLFRATAGKPGIP